jgi:cell fate regulator YaaT (PSP1 superfamily)
VTAAAVQTHLVEVEFKGNRRAFFTWAGEAPPPARAAVIVQVERGEDLGRVHATGELAEKRKAGTTHGKASPNELPRVVRLATKAEIETAVRLRADEDAVRRAALEIVRELKLDMKVSDAEWQWDRRRLTCYFTAEERVDFRQLVRQLEKRFGARVHMWHIGVRDEARRLDGIGRCGRQFCSSSWLPELRPVKSSSAKDQRLSTLNPAQISGTCGRLMCCLRYEHEFYVQSRKRFPKEGKVLETAGGRGEGREQRHLPRPGHAPHGRWRVSHHPAQPAQARTRRHLRPGGRRAHARRRRARGVGDRHALARRAAEGGAVARA